MSLLNTQHLIYLAASDIAILRKHLANIVVQSHPRRAHVVSQKPGLELKVRKLGLIQVQLDSNFIQRSTFVNQLLKQPLFHDTKRYIDCIRRSIQSLKPRKFIGNERTKCFLHFIPCIINIAHRRKQRIKLVKFQQLIVTLDHSFGHLEYRQVISIQHLCLAEHGMNSLAFRGVCSSPSPALAHFLRCRLCDPISCIIQLSGELLHSGRTKAHRIIRHKLHSPLVCDGEVLERFIEDLPCG